MSCVIVPFSAPAAEAQKRLERDMVVEVCRRIAEAFADVAELGGVSVEDLRALVMRAEAEVLEQ